MCRRSWLNNSYEQGIGLAVGKGRKALHCHEYQGIE